MAGIISTSRVIAGVNTTEEKTGTAPKEQSQMFDWESAEVLRTTVPTGIQISRGPFTVRDRFFNGGGDDTTVFQLLSCRQG